ncbi:DUF402 domain-containing protein [Halovenus sp. WSH3]|uniref:Probable ribonuclease FAU-1 n=1 Tax=Halovenus carboxidivorans TaxID=2692199 RepID=A0A6B0T2W7_9EURY|nr:DUF402 domain-containing protein [Halovenus carboxidivorans]MXR51467.1 DUF402 domain-containing protein [Halovenus carboxidivorans]
MTVRVRGIYSTALTERFEEIVQPSKPIEERFDREFSMGPATVAIETTEDRQGVGVHGAPGDVGAVVSALRDLALDTFVWRGALPRNGIFAGEVVDTLGSGALVRCLPEDTGPESILDDPAPVGGETTGFLPYSNADERIEDGDRLQVQVIETRAPWSDGRPVLDTSLRVAGGLATLRRGGQHGRGPELADLLPEEPPEGWAADWAPLSDQADLDELGAVVEHLSGHAATIDEQLADAPEATDHAPGAYVRPEATYWVWFGRESRFALDEWRRNVTTTMAGHHRIKAGTETASTAVDFAEGICDEPGTGPEAFPFEVVAEQFGPRDGDRIDIGHGKPDGRLIELGPGEVTDRTSDGQVTVRREISSRGSYDALGTEREPGDIAVTKFQEDRWWYPTVYRGEDGTSKGTYVNVCTPVEIFPNTVRYIDLHVDVIKTPDGTTEIVDDDELTAAVEAGQVDEQVAEKARTVASAVENAF